MFRHQSSTRFTSHARSVRLILLLALFVSTLTVATVAQPSGQVTSPQKFLGFQPTSSRTIADWRQIVNYFALLDKESPRISVKTLGATTQGRPFIVTFISSPDNLRQLEKYQDINRRLADSRLIKSDAEQAELIRTGKTIVAVSCSIHSTEIVASQMSMLLAHELATAQDNVTRNILDNTILLLIPSANPDGVDIISRWYRRTFNTKHEGTEPPELYHPYAGHDNNRDWFMLNLRETRLVTKLFWKEWFPHIVYDVHQQGQAASRFFIPPFYDPAYPRIAPYLLREVGSLGSRIAADLQAQGEPGVITNAVYDMWWHGGFRTAPYYHNSIGILSEAASARLMTPVTISPEQLARSQSRGMPSALQAAINFPAPWTGGVWKPEDIARLEMTATRTLLREASERREHYLTNFVKLSRAHVAQPVTEGEPLAHLLPIGQGNNERLAHLIEVLTAQGVEVHRLTRELHTRAVDAKDNRFIETPLGSYLVPLNQPYRANVQALFERQIYPNRKTATGETERPYDVAGWTLPLQMGVESIALAAIQEKDFQASLKAVDSGDEVRRDLGLTAGISKSSTAASRSNAFAYLTDGATLPHSTTGRYANPFTQPPRIALYRSWTNNMDEGWTRLVFDSHSISYATLRDADIKRGALKASYDVIVLPSQRMKSMVEGNSANEYPLEYAGGITEKGVANLRAFVEAGGTLICFDAASEVAIKSFDLPVRNVLENVKPIDFYCPGSILALEVETTHPLATGFNKQAVAYFINSSAFEIDASKKSSVKLEEVRVVARYAHQNLLLSGYLLGEKMISGKPALVEVKLGQGRVVLFAFRPQHRGQAWATVPFIFNAMK